MEHINITGSQVAGNNISNSNNNNKNISINRIRTESAIISFVIGFLSSVLASLVFHYLIK